MFELMTTTAAVSAQKNRHNETILLSPHPPPQKKKIFRHHNTPSTITWRYPERYAIYKCTAYRPVVFKFVLSRILIEPITFV